MTMQIRLWIGTVLLGGILATQAYASDASFEKSMARGIAAIEAQDYRTATDEFKGSLAEHPDDPEANLYLGIALSRSNDPGCETVLKKALLLAPDNPRTSLELGIYYYGRQISAEAVDYFDNAKKLAPGSDIAAKADQFLALLARTSSDKRWRVKLLTGMQYDSNVVLNADGSPLPQGISGKSDWRGIINGGASYSLLQSGSIDLTASYNIYQSLHTELSDFDITQNLLELGGEYRFSPLVTFKGSYSYEYLLLGGNSYDQAHNITPAVTFNTGKGLSTTIDYRFRTVSYQDFGIFTTNSERNGSNHQFGIMQKIPCGESVTARIGYAHDEELTKSDFWDYSGDKGSIGLLAKLPGQLVLDLSADLASRRYSGDFPSFATPRDDLVSTLSTTLSTFFGDHFILTAGFFYNRNQSNLAPFDYVRTITSLLLSARY